jgi:hypothetical protein
VECDGNVFLSMCDPYFDTSSKCWYIYCACSTQV